MSNNVYQMSPDEIRLECLKLSAGVLHSLANETATPQEVVARAEAYLEFMMAGKQE